MFLVVSYISIWIQRPNVIVWISPSGWSFSTSACNLILLQEVPVHCLPPKHMVGARSTAPWQQGGAAQLCGNENSGRISIH